MITREFAPVRRRLDDVVAWVLANVRLRRGLPELVALARARGWRVLVLSSGFVELIEPVLEREGLDVELKANRVEPELSGWRVIWRDETVCTECGEACKRTGLPTDGEIMYVGDGISDRCAALASDRIFATHGLARFLDERGVPFESFDDFHDVVAALRTRGQAPSSPRTGGTWSGASSTRGAGRTSSGSCRQTRSQEPSVCSSRRDRHRSTRRGARCTWATCAAQLAQALDNLETVLREAGFGLGDSCVSTTTRRTSTRSSDRPTSWPSV